jgi:hypothetical protein
MYEMYGRDEYAASHMRGPGCAFWTLWALATVIGATLGQLGAQTLIRAMLPGENPPLEQVIAAAVPAGALMGVAIGAAQGAILLRYIGARGFGEWVLASVVGGILRWTVIGPLGYLLMATMNVGIVVCNYLIPLFLYGAIAGAVFGAPQALVLERRLGRVTSLDGWAWTLAYAAGGLIYMPFVMLGGLMLGALDVMLGVVSDAQYQSALIAVTLNWLIAGILTGLPLRDHLRMSKAIVFDS